MNRKNWRKMHRWTGLFVLGFILFYCLTGLLLNHRKYFGYFQTRHKAVTEMQMQQQDVLNKMLSQIITTYKQQIGRNDDPAVIRLKREGVIEFLYGSHGSTTYVVDSTKGIMTRIEKEKQQPWYWLNRLHKSYKVAPGWIWLTDCIAILILVLALSGLFLFRYTWLDIMLLVSGAMVMGIGMLLT